MMNFLCLRLRYEEKKSFLRKKKHKKQFKDCQGLFANEIIKLINQNPKEYGVCS